YPSIAIDNNGTMYVVWQDETDGEWGTDIEIMYVNNNGSGWSNATVISDVYRWNDDISWNPSVAVDNNNYLHVVWGDDTNGEWGTDREIMYSVYETEDPNIISVLRNPLNPGNLDIVNITVYITDNIGVDTVLINSNHIGTPTNYTMDLLSGTTQDGYWNYTIPAKPAETTINYSIWVFDRCNNYAIDGPYQYTIRDNENPNIISVLRDPSNPGNLDTVNITVHITDNLEIDTVLINANHTGIPTNYTMDQLSGVTQDGYWNYTIPFNSVGTTIIYSIWVNDTYDNYDIDGPNEYTILDNEVPNINSVSRDPSNPDSLDTVNITVYITENIGVDNVLINSNHSGTPTNYTMDLLFGTTQDGYWNYTIPASPMGLTIIYSIWVNDTNNNYATDGPYEYTIPDTIDPNIISISKIPANPGNLDTVNVTVHITDNARVKTVLINSNHSGSPTNYTMDLLSGTTQDGYWNYTIPAYSTGTTIIYLIWVNDTNNNYDITGSYNYTIRDNENPNIIMVSQEPNQPDSLDIVNITTHITDNVGVYSVLIISNHTGVFTDYAMDLFSGTTQDGYWNFTIPQLPLGTIINYSIRVNDTSNNNMSSIYYEYTVVDNEDPNIVSVLRDPPNPGNLDIVNIAVHISDNIEVNTVLINSNHTGTPTNYTMDLLSGTTQDGYWNYTIPAYPAGIKITYSIWVNDTSNNSATNGPYQYTILDNEDPNIVSVLRDPSNPGNLDIVNIIVHISDNIGVNTVLINSNHTGTPTNYTMDLLSGTTQDGYWNYTIPAYSAGTIIVYLIWVDDTNNNYNITGLYNYTIRDNENPNIIMVSQEPNQPQSLDLVNITTYITDNVGAYSVLIISNHTGVFSDYTMDLFSGTTQDGYWNFTIPQLALGTTINYSIWVNDTSNNNISSIYYDYIVVDIEDPFIISVSRNPNQPGSLDSVKIIIHLTDNEGIHAVLLISDHSGIFANYSMTLSSGTIQDGYWSFTIPKLAPGTTINYIIWANDTSGNTVSSSYYEYEVNNMYEIIFTSSLYGQLKQNKELNDLIFIIVFGLVAVVSSGTSIGLYVKKYKPSKIRKRKAKHKDYLLNISDITILDKIDSKFKAIEGKSKKILNSYMKKGQVSGIYFNDTTFIPNSLISTIKKSINGNLFKFINMKSIKYVKDQAQDIVSFEKIDLKPLITYCSMEILYFIVNHLINKGEIVGYIQEDQLIFPLSYGIKVFASNAIGTIDVKILSKDFLELEKYGQLILGFIHKNKRPPEREEAWKLGVPFDYIDNVISYINIQIKTSIYDKLSPREKEYFDNLSLQVISYLKKFKVDPSLEVLVSEFGLGVKDAKLIIPFINEVLGEEEIK
ncbi:MAG: hypothetical protein ACFFDN_19480, partial [Candidatus Hodarchaeota archaeon]